MSKLKYISLIILLVGVSSCKIKHWKTKKYETIEAEAQAIADSFSPLWFDEKRLVQSAQKRTTFAVLVRKRSQIAAIESALRSAGMPVDVIGLGGLIHVPEVADIVSMLKIIADPDAGAAMMRHLTGPRINLGAKDLAALGAYSRNRAKGSRAENKSLIKCNY